MTTSAKAVFVAFGVALASMPAFAQPTKSGLVAFGPADAPVQVIEVMSVTCPACREFHADGGLFERFRDSYIEKDMVHWIIQDYYIHRPDLWISLIARCGPPEGRYGRTKHLLDRIPVLLEDSDPNGIATRLRREAATMGLTKEQTETCLSDSGVAASLMGAQEDLLEGYDLVDNPDFGTPFFIVNGEPVWNYEGTVSYQRVNDAIFDEYKRVTGQ